MIWRFIYGLECNDTGQHWSGFQKTCSFSTSVILSFGMVVTNGNILWTFKWLVSYLIALKTSYLKSSTSTLTSAIGSSSYVFVSFACLFWLVGTDCLCGIYSTSCQSSISEWALTFSFSFSSLLFLGLQGKLVCLLYRICGQQVHVILDLISQPINISGYSFRVIFLVPCLIFTL